MDEYTIYRVKQFQEVTCPNPFCDLPIETDGNFFLSLPNDVQERYKKIKQWHQTHQDSNMKMCPA